jgi:hypothetical protein
MALLVTSVFGVTGCGSDDDEAPVESRIKNYSNESYFIHPLCERSLYSESLVCARGSNGAGEGAEFEELEELEDFMKFDDLGERLSGEDVRGYPHITLSDNELKNKELEEGISPSSISDLISDF